MRLIDADALKQKILEERNKIPLTVPAAYYELVREKANTHGNSMRGGIRIALRCMENTPTIEAEPVRHGRWIDKGVEGDFSWKLDGRGSCWRVLACSVCGKNLCGRPGSDFCPYCGAKMDLK